MRRETTRVTVFALVALAGAGLTGLLRFPVSSSRAARVATADLPRPSRSSSAGRPALAPVGPPALASARSPDAAEAADGPPAPEPSPAATRPATVSGAVVGTGGVPFRGGGTVELRTASGTALRAPLEPDGTFRLEVPPGVYACLLLPAGLPAGWLPPFGQELGAGPDPGPELDLGARVVEASAPGGRYAVELRVLAAASARGRVVDGDGAPVAGAGVRLRSARVAERIVDARTDAAGAWELEGLYPDTYMLELRLGQARDPAQRGLPAPGPRTLVVAEGARLVLDDLRLGAEGTSP